MTHDSYAFVGGTVLPITSDPISDGVVVVRDGKIEAIGHVSIPDDATVIDASGLFVAPGFIEAHGHIGIWEEANGPAGEDANEGTAAITPALRAIDAINIDDEGFRDALRGGVTTAVIKPGSGNVIGGVSVAMKTWGGLTIDQQTIKEPASVKAALGENPKRFHGSQGRLPATRMGVSYAMRNALIEAANYVATKDAAAAKGEPFARDLGKEVLAQVLAGELIWDQHVHRHDDLATALRIQEEFDLKLVVNHGTEGGKLAPLLAQRNIPVIYGPILTSRSKVELRDRGLDQLLTMAEAGVRLAITTDHPVVPINHLILQAQLAVREGLDPKIALEALTINPATFMGIEERVGSLEVGKDADLVLWSHHPLDLAARPHRVFIDGREVLRHDQQGRVEIVERF